MKMKWTIRQLIIVATVACVAALAVVYAARAGETPVYDANGRYNGSVINNGNGTQTYVDRNGHFSGSAIDNAPASGHRFIADDAHRGFGEQMFGAE